VGKNKFGVPNTGVEALREEVRNRKDDSCRPRLLGGRSWGGDGKVVFYLQPCQGEKKGPPPFSKGGKHYQGEINDGYRQGTKKF